MIGEARCVVVDARQPPVGDFAIAVAGDWQRRGLGRILLSRLISHAAASGISRLVANTLAGNAGMVALAERCGFAALPERSDRQLRASSGSCRQQMCTGSMTCGRCVA
jgi:acetyltransferase